MPQWPWQVKKSARKIRGLNKSCKWIENCIKWHCNSKNEDYKQLFLRIFKRNYDLIVHLFHFKRFQMNVSDSNEFQYFVHLSNKQMDKVQSFIRSKTGLCILSSRTLVHEYNDLFVLNSALVAAMGLMVMKKLFQERQQLIIQETNVYHCCKNESLERLTQSALDNDRFKIPSILSKDSLVVEIGWDKCTAGLIESVAIGITDKYHGKYGSIITTWTPQKIAENYHNYRELAHNLQNKQRTEELLKFPTLNVFCTVRKNSQNTNVCLNYSVGIVTLDIESQKAVDTRYADVLNAIESPSPMSFVITAEDINAALTDNSETKSRTVQFWQSINQTYHPPPFYMVKLPTGIQPPTTTPDNTITYDTLVKQSWTLYNSITTEEDSCADNDHENDSDLDPDSESSVSDNYDVVRTNAHLRRPGISVTDSNASSDNVNDNVNDNENANGNENANDNVNENADDNVNVEHVLHDLLEYKWNANSGLTRMQQSDWDWQKMHIKSSYLQGDALHLLPYSFITSNDRNCDLPCINDTIAQFPFSSLIFDLEKGLKHVWLDNDDYNSLNLNSDNDNYFFGVTNETHIIGLIQCYIPTDSVNNENVQLIIQQRRSLHIFIDITKMSWYNAYMNDNAAPQTIQLSDNNDEFKQMVQSHTDNECVQDNDTECKLMWYRFELDAFLEFDNKAANLCYGYSTHASRYPCTQCEVTSQQVYDFPTPDNMCWKSRQTGETFFRTALKRSKKHPSVGCKQPPIFDAPVHKHGPPTMHDWEGICFVIMQTFQDFISTMCDHDALLDNDQAKFIEIEKMYEEILHLQDLKTTPTIQDNPDWADQIAKNDIKLATLVNEYNREHNMWEARMKTTNANNYKCIFLQILRKYHINLYYKQNGSLQGTTCARICDASEELIELAINIDFVGGVLWKHLFINLKYLYFMVKRKCKQKYTTFELASMKYSYINMYHQMLLVVYLWRKSGLTGKKIHFLVHVLEQCFHLKMSTGFIDDERFENVNQHAKDMEKLYQGWNGNRHGCKQMFMAKRLNGRALSCG